MKKKINWQILKSALVYLYNMIYLSYLKQHCIFRSWSELNAFMTEAVHYKKKEN